MNIIILSNDKGGSEGGTVSREKMVILKSCLEMLGETTQTDVSIFVVKKP